MWLVPVATAADLVAEVGEEVRTGVGGGWARAFPRGDGTWSFLWSAGGDYNLLPMGEDLSVVDRDRVLLTGRTDLVDHAIARCPDGTYLHVASANVESPDDSAFAFHYDADFAALADTPIEERTPTSEHHDPPVLCSPFGNATVFAEGTPDGARFVELDADGAPIDEIRLDHPPYLIGGSLAYDADTDTLLTVGFGEDESMVVERYDRDMTRIDSRSFALAEPGQRLYWTQATERVGQHWVVAHMARDDGAGWTADEGNVYVEVFDLDWNHEQTVAVTAFSPPTGAMRPGLARDGDTLLVLYDVSTEPRITPLTLDDDAVGDEPDTGDTGSPEAGPIAASRTCGCGGGGGGGAAALLLLVPRRRWRSS